MSPLLVAAVAKICHETNRAYCQSLGDYSQTEWELAPEWQRASAKKGVEFHASGEHGPDASHESWRVEKLAQGWKYGPVKDPAKKEHPCMVPFAELPPEQMIKDCLFAAIVYVFKST